MGLDRRQLFLLGLLLLFPSLFLIGPSPWLFDSSSSSLLTFCLLVASLSFALLFASSRLELIRGVHEVTGLNPMDAQLASKADQITAAFCGLACSTAPILCWILKYQDLCTIDGIVAIFGFVTYLGWYLM